MKKTWKRILALFLVVLMAFTFTACKKEKTVKDKKVDKEDNLTEIIDISEEKTDDVAEENSNIEEENQNAKETEKKQQNEIIDEKEQNKEDTTQEKKVDDGKTNIELPIIGVN